MINLNLDILNVPKPTTKSELWVDIANMFNSKLAIDVARRKVVAVVSHDREVCAAIELLAHAHQTIKTYGASESIMAIFNQDNQLADCIGMNIPQITEANAQAVGIACCENIDSTISDAYVKVKQFFVALVNTTTAFFEKLNAQSNAQSKAIDSLVNTIDKDIDNESVVVENNNLFGYTQPVFMDRVSALSFIVKQLPACEATNASMMEFAPALKTLGYKIVEKSSEGLVDGEYVALEPELKIVPDTAQEEEQPAEEGKPEEPSSVQMGVSKPTGSEATESLLTPQSGTFSSFKWTVGGVKEAALSVKNLLSESNTLAPAVTNKISSVRGAVETAIEAISSTEGQDKIQIDNAIVTGRRFASFIGDLLAIYSSSTDELVDQIVGMSARLITNEEQPQPAPEAAPEQSPEGGEQQEQPAPEQGGSEQPATNGIEQPENVPNTKPVDPNTKVCPNGEPHPGTAPHVEPVETPEEQQPKEKTETLIEDVSSTKLW